MIQKKQKKSLVYAFIIMVIAVVVYNMSFAKEIKVYFEDNQEDAGENTYAVDLYVDTGDEKVGGFQLKLSYPECLEMAEVIDGDVGQTNMNKYAKNVTGQKSETSEGKSGKVKLCTVVFRVIESSSDGKYDVKVNYSDNYSRIIGVDGKRIDVDEEQNNGGSNNNGENNNNGQNNNGETNNSGNNNQEGGEEVSVADNNGEYKENMSKDGKLPNAGASSAVIIVDIALIVVTAVLGIKLLKYNKKDL